MTSELQYRSASAYSVQELSSLFARSFEGYFMPVTDDPVGFASRLRADQTDLAASVVLLDQGKEIGLALICRRGERSRVGGMGLVADARGRGLGKALMEKVIQDARERHDSELVLEVITQNEGAVKLYEQCGFSVTRRLLGYQAVGVRGKRADLQPVTMTEVARFIQDGATSLPWQLQPASLGAATWPSQAVKLGNAVALLTKVENTVHLRTVFVPPLHRQRGEGRRLMEALFAQFPDARFVIPALVPEELAHGFLAKLGFTTTELSQLEMSLQLAGTSDESNGLARHT